MYDAQQNTHPNSMVVSCISHCGYSAKIILVTSFPSKISYYNSNHNNYIHGLSIHC